MSDRASVHMWVSEPIDGALRKAIERLSFASDVQHVAIMPDVHLADDVCIGTALATRHLIYPAAVGGDIGCGVCAIRFEGSTDVADPRSAKRIFAGLRELVPVMRHASCPRPDAGLWATDLSARRLSRLRDRDGLSQLGTLGRGNHFAELQRCEAGDLWLMVHSGSRAMGQAIRDHHLQHAERSRGGLLCLDARTQRGRQYLADMAWALDYARVNRERLTAAAGEVLAVVLGIRPDPESYIDSHHNHVVQMNVAGSPLWVHRKGAISAREGEPGLIPGSMGSASFHVRGLGLERALCSSSHGAGRRMSRAQARRRITVEDLERQAKGVWFERRRARGLIDEAPGAYKDVEGVMRAQRALTRVVRRLEPLLSYKGA